MDRETLMSVYAAITTELGTLDTLQALTARVLEDAHDTDTVEAGECDFLMGAQKEAVNRIETALSKLLAA